MLGEQRGAVVIIARVITKDVRVLFRRQGADYVRKLHVALPGRAAVVGLVRPHPVARNSRVALRAAGALPRVIPDSQEGASRADRKVRLPLRTGSGIGVQLDRRAKGETTVSRADVIDVAFVGARTMLGIDQVNRAVVRRQAHPSPRAASSHRYRETCR